MSAHPQAKHGTGDREMVKAILLEIILQSDGRFNGRTRLYKAFYIAHLFHFRDSSGILSNWSIVHMPQGHGIHDGERIIREMEEAGLIRRETVHTGPYPEDCYTANRPYDHGLLDAQARQSIGKAVVFVADKSGKDLSAISHEQFSYISGQSGKELPIYLDLLTDEERELELEKTRRISDLMGGAPNNTD